VHSSMCNPLIHLPLCSSLNFLGGAYAADSTNCGLFVLRVVDAILQAIREEGAMDEMW